MAHIFQVVHIPGIGEVEMGIIGFPGMMVLDTGYPPLEGSGLHILVKRFETENPKDAFWHGKQGS
jgi:hypothetical protein